MAPVNFHKILSVNSEDPIYKAQNLLIKDNPSKKWKCKTPGEKQAIVILQLEKTTKIIGIDIGNEYSAFVEVLVGKSTSNNDDFKVLLVASTLMTFDESKNGDNINGVKFYKTEDLSKPTAEESWDKIKIICTQPFNKHVQFGLSFVIVHGISETDESNSDKLPSLGRFMWKEAETKGTFVAGSLFSKKKEYEPLKGAAAIREASNLAGYVNGATKHSKIVDIKPATSSKNNIKTDISDSDERRSLKGPLLYETDDTEEPSKNKVSNEQTNNSFSISVKKEEGVQKEESENTDKIDPRKNRPQNKKHFIHDDGFDAQQSSSSLSISESAKSSKKRKVEKKWKNFHELLDDVVFVISGFENPYRAELRSKALEMGAKYKPDWNISCTHLICAFPNTPKFNQVRGKGKIVTKDWIEKCHSKRKKLPWRRFALDKKEKKKPESEEEIGTDTSTASDSDTNNTDEEVIKIKQKQQAVDPYDETTDIDDENEESRPNLRKKPNTSKLPVPHLPDFFLGKTFYISSLVRSTTAKAYLLRCIVAYKGKLVSDLSSHFDYVIVDSDYSSTSHTSIDLIREKHSNVIVVKQEWIRECSVKGELVSNEDYIC